MAQAAATHADRVLYTAMIHTAGGRENGAARSSDGNLDVKISTPGSKRAGTNPEQLFGAGWSACLESAIGIVAHQRKIALAGDIAIDAEIDLNLGDSGYFLAARLNIAIPGVARDVAQTLVDEGKKLCPYSKATLGNINVAYNVV